RHVASNGRRGVAAGRRHQQLGGGLGRSRAGRGADILSRGRREVHRVAAFIFTGRGVGHRRQRGIDVGQRTGDQNRIGQIVTVAAADGRGQAAAERKRAVPDIERGGEAVGVVGAAV